MKLLSRAGSTYRVACGRMIAQNVLQADSPRARAAWTWPKWTLWMPALNASAS